MACAAAKVLRSISPLACGRFSVGRMASRIPRTDAVDADANSDDSDAVDGAPTSGDKNRVSYTASLISQGKHRFYTLSMRSEILAETCIVEPRNEEPIEGFQRALDRRRAQEIAQYIDGDFGIIPSSIVLSAQEDADLEYRRSTRTISFKKTPKSFIISDGQHRVYGFGLSQSTLRVPVVVYNGITRTEECR